MFIEFNSKIIPMMKSIAPIQSKKYFIATLEKREIPPLASIAKARYRIKKFTLKRIARPDRISRTLKISIIIQRY